MTKSTKNVKFVWKFWKWDFQFSTRFIKFPALFIFGVTLTSLVTLTFDLGIRNFHTIFLVMLAICVHEFNRIQVFFLDKNHLKTPKVMTLTFDLENGKRPYLIKLWCILCLNAKFCYCILKNSLNGDLLNYIASKKEKTSMTSGDLDLWDMVTKKNLYNPGCVLDILAKNDVDPTISLGGVRPHTHTQTEDLRLL